MSQTQRVWTVPGGIHPPENKQQSLRTGIEIPSLPDLLVLPLSQHIGAPAHAVVAIGDTILKGQCIAEPTGQLSAAIHAPTSGTVIAIEPRVIAHASGMESLCIVIKPDGHDTWITLNGIEHYHTQSADTLRECIRQAGIVGMGGAGFPSATKLTTQTNAIDTLIINATECEPFITADDALLQAHTAEVVKGIGILQHVIKPTQHTLIGIEDNKPNAIEALRKATQDTDIQVVVFPTKYPSGGEKQLIYILTGKEIPHGKLPADIGIVCQNVGTTRAIYHAVVHGKPLISRITTVTGNYVPEPKNLEVLIGTPFAHALSHCGMDDDHINAVDRLIMGGPMMGFTVQDANVPIVKTTNCILVPNHQELPAESPAQACIRCGMCEQACPVSLLPQQLYWYAQSDNHEALKQHHLMDCIECGACSYVCPSHIPLVQYYRASKSAIRQADQNHSKAEHAKQRFNDRQARLEKIEQEKAEKRKARQAKAASAKARGNDDPVAKALAKANDAVTDAKSKSADVSTKKQVLEDKLKNTQINLAIAKTQNDDSTKALQTAVDKLQQRLDQLNNDAISASDDKT